MGRGRAKAKQQKVARDLKYNTPMTDLDSLARELASDPHQAGNGSTSVEAERFSADDFDDDGERWASNTG
jgi:Protein of unknown function (DUF3073)